MSRFYAMEMGVEKAEMSEKEFQTTRQVFAEEWTSDEGVLDVDEEGAVAKFSAEGTLTGGKTEEEAHDRMVKAVKAKIPNCRVITRWTYLEELPFDEYVN